MQQAELIPHLFRTEFRKITAVLCSHFGLRYLEEAEDIAGDTFLAALETWPYRGIPGNPAAWLYTVAKNKARNQFSRSRVFSEKVTPALKASADADPAFRSERPDPEPDLSEANIRDSQLRMMFAVCHPLLPAESQVALALRVLCGFGIDEIASAFLTSKETVNKRLFRAREKLRQGNILPELPGAAEIDRRLNAVLMTLYLLYNEGYHSAGSDNTLRKDCCLEAMQLTSLLLENPLTAQTSVHALMALMCFHTSRFDARDNGRGEAILYQDQDESRWNKALIAKGVTFLHKASAGDQLSRYHLEASIAYWNTVKKDTPEKWKTVLHLHNLLLQIAYSPVAALNRTYAFSKVHGKAAAIREAEKLGLTDNRFYHTLLGDLYAKADPSRARTHYEQALNLARTTADRDTIRKKLTFTGTSNQGDQ